MKFKKFLVSFLSIILLIFSTVIFANSIKTHRDNSAFSVSEKNSMPKISKNLDRLFTNYNDSLVSNFLSYQKKHNSLNWSRNNVTSDNIENKILEFIFYIDDEIFVDFEGLKIFNLPKEMIDIFSSKEFSDSIKESINNNVFIISNNNILHNKNFMINNDIEIDDTLINSRSNNRDFWVRHRWFWFVYFRVEMSSRGRQTLISVGIGIFVTIAENILKAADFVELLGTTLASYGLTFLPAVLSALAWVLLIIGAILLASIFIYTQTLRSFRTYPSGAYIGILAILVTDWGML